MLAQPAPLVLFPRCFTTGAEGTMLSPKCMADKKISIAKLKTIVELVNETPGRPKDGRGRPGGLVELPKTHTSVIVGDLHGAREHLLRILEHGGNEQGLAGGTRILILVGDTVHNDQTGMLREMSSSLETLEEVFSLFLRFPNRVVYVRGNHDSFDEGLVKSGIRQGAEFRAYVVAARGEKYAALVEKFFDALPVFVIGEGFVVAHAGPVRGGSSREELIEVHSDPDRYLQLQWNRINEFGGTANRKEYDGYDVRKTIERLRLPARTHFIVGHNPLWNTGNTSGLWRNVLGIENHHILYSGANTQAPYLSFTAGKLTVHEAIAAKKEAVYV
jgi:hypothetical protein